MLGGMAKGQKSGYDDLVKIIVSVIYLFFGKELQLDITSGLAISRSFTCI